MTQNEPESQYLWKKTKKKFTLAASVKCLALYATTNAYKLWPWPSQSSDIYLIQKLCKSLIHGKLNELKLIDLPNFPT